MTFSTNGPIYFSQLNLESGKAYNSPINLGDPATISLLNKIAGTTATTATSINFSDLKGQGLGLGKTWTPISSNTTSDLISANYLSGNWGITGKDATFMLSTDGRNWVRQTFSTVPLGIAAVSTSTLVGSAFGQWVPGNTQYGLIGSNSVVIQGQSSPFATYAFSSQPSTPTDIASSGSWWVASGHSISNGWSSLLWAWQGTGGTIGWNEGWTGQNASTGTKALVLSVARSDQTSGNGRFIAVGQRGLRLTSADGQSWDIANYGTTISCALSYNDNGGIVLGAGGNFYTGSSPELGLYQSTNGTTFFKRFGPTGTVNPVSLASTSTRLCMLKNGGGNGTPAVYMASISGDTITALSGPHLFPGGSNQYFTVTRSDKYWIAAGGTTVHISPDPTTVTFTGQSYEAGADWYGSESTGSTVVLAGFGTRSVSTNSGVSWVTPVSIPNVGPPPYNYYASNGWRSVSWASTSSRWIMTADGPPLIVTTSTAAGATGTWQFVDLGLNSSNTSTIINSGGINKSYYAGNKFWFAGNGGLLGQMGGDLSNPRFVNTLTNRSFNAIAHKVVNTASNLCYVYFYGENGVIARCLSNADISAAELLEPGEDLYKVRASSAFVEAVGASNTYMTTSDITGKYFYADTYAGINTSNRVVKTEKGSTVTNRGVYITPGNTNGSAFPEAGVVSGDGQILAPSGGYTSLKKIAQISTTTQLNAIIGTGGGVNVASWALVVGNSGTMYLSTNNDLPIIGYCIVGGGGAGGWATDGLTPGVSSAGGGGGGGDVRYGYLKMSPGSILTITVGANGLPVVNGNGGDGGRSSVTGIGEAEGGRGGRVGQGTIGGLGGQGGWGKDNIYIGQQSGYTYGGDAYGGQGGSGGQSYSGINVVTNAGGGPGGTGPLTSILGSIGYVGSGGGGGGIYSVTNATLYKGGGGATMASGQFQSGAGALTATSSTDATVPGPWYGGGGGGGGGPNQIATGTTTSTQAATPGTTGTVWLWYQDYWSTSTSAVGALYSTAFMSFGSESTSLRSRLYKWTTPGTYTFTTPS
jgi:hypothetical protein